MGRHKKKSIRCKTSKKEHKHVNKQEKKLKALPATDQYQIPLNQIIDQNGKSSVFVRHQLLKQSQSSMTANKSKLTSADKLKANAFLFGVSPSNSTKAAEKSTTETDEALQANDFIDSDEEDLEDNGNDDSNVILSVCNLDRRVNERMLSKIINKKLTAQQIEVNCIQITCISNTKVAKIKLAKPSASQIRALLNGRKLFGKAMKCEIVNS